MTGTDFEYLQNILNESLLDDITKDDFSDGTSSSKTVSAQSSGPNRTLRIMLGFCLDVLKIDYLLDFNWLSEIRRTIGCV